MASSTSSKRAVLYGPLGMAGHIWNRAFSNARWLRWLLRISVTAAFSFVLAGVIWGLMFHEVPEGDRSRLLVLAGSALGIGSAVGLNALRMWDDNRRARRQYAVQMIGRWNAIGLPAQQKIAKTFPFNKRTRKREMSDDQAERIYDSDGEWIVRAKSQRSQKEIKKDLAMRKTFVQLLNHIEQIATAYNKEVADRDVIHVDFIEVALEWYEFLRPFRAASKDRWERDRWPAIRDAKSLWEKELNRRRRLREMI